MMTPEEIQALKDAVAAAEQAAKDARSEAEKYKSDITNIVEELKEERRKKQEALDKAGGQGGEQDISSIIESKIAEREAERRKAEIENAIQAFKASKTEFQNDTTGLVFEKFKNELKKFNLSDIVDKETATKRLEEVYRFVNLTGKSENENLYDGSGRSAPSINESNRDETRDTESLIQSTNIDKDKFLKLKNKYGDAFSGLGIK